jgi:hypothetical protein
MTLSDYRALKAGLEEIADLTDKIRLINEGEVKEIQRRIAIKDTEISDLKSSILKRRGSEKTLELRKRTLEAAFQEKYPDIPLTEENVFEKLMHYYDECESGKWRFSAPKEIPYRAYLMESRFFISIFIASLFLSILFLTGAGMEWRPDFLNYQCDSGEKIDVWRVGNGVENCSDGSDEGNIQFVSLLGDLDYLSIIAIFMIWFCLDLALLTFHFRAYAKSLLTRKDESEFGPWTVWRREFYKSHFYPDDLPTTFVDLLRGIWFDLEYSSHRKRYDRKEEESKISEELNEVYQEITICVYEQGRMSRKLELLIGEREAIESELPIQNAKIDDLIGAIADVNKTIAHLIPR